ncbi:hypothetical protein ACFSS8_09815 [Paracoccus kondratievae]
MPGHHPFAPCRLLLALIALILLSLPMWAAPPAAPDAVQAQALFGADGPVVLDRRETPVPGWGVSREGRALGMIGSTWEIAATTGYSGKPLDVLVAVTPQGIIAGALLVRQTEPVLSLGISDAHIAAYVDGFRGVDLSQPRAGTVRCPR